MAFGEKTKEYANKGNDGEQKHFDSQWMPTGSGTRLFRVLPEVRDGEIVLTPRLSPNGKELREGDKKTGKVLTGPVPAEETVFLYAWWEVMVDGALKPKRLMLNASGANARFNNPLWKHIEKNYPKGDNARRAIKLGFAMNVWDMSPVLRNDENELFYLAEDGTFSLLAYMNNGRLIADQSKLPKGYKESDAGTPLNQIRIFEGSYGEPGGKHLFQQLADLHEQVEDANGMFRRLCEFDLRMKTTGIGLKTNRSIRNGQVKLLDPAIAFLPRFDLATWTQPWPDEAITRLIDGEDYNEIVEEYTLATFPFLETNDEDAVDPTDPKAYAPESEATFD